MIPNSITTVATFKPNLLNSPTAWLGHLPFAALAIQEVKPRIFVELGTHYGHSYFAFCQAVVESHLPTKCYAVDTWQGDEHAGHYSEEIFTAVNAHNQQHYAGFSRLLKMTFDDAAENFSDQSIDLLHIDGLHTYDAVRHDFDTWLPKLAPGAVIIFHDINVRERDFGVWRLWEELQAQYPHNLEMLHSHGLGILQLNNAPVGKEMLWLQGSAADKHSLQTYFAALGEHQADRVEITNLRQHRDHLGRIIGERDAEIADLNQTITKRNILVTDLNRGVSARDAQIADLNREVSERDAQIANLNREVSERDNIIREIFNTKSWRLTYPMRRFKSFFLEPSKSNVASPESVVFKYVRQLRLIYSLLPAASRHAGGVRNTLAKAWEIYQREGLTGVKRRLTYLHTTSIQIDAAPVFFKRNGETSPISADRILSESDVALMREQIKEFSLIPLISVLLPTYNPQPEWLEKAIESVRAQIYPHWELCIADDASTHPAIRSILERHAQEDTRIKVVFRKTNGNISAASNSALEIATGDYLALLDHDDELTVDALYWNVREICSYPDTDVIYSDEDKISPDGRRTDFFFKPDWSPELMFNCMYMGHLTIYKKSLILRIGGFNSQFDFSQDYDLALRATEVAKEIRHIPRILYHWRQADGSAAQGGKPYARASNVAALQAAIDRRGITGEVIALPTANRVKVTEWQPQVSIIIPTDSETTLIACLDALAEKTDYPSWEVIIVTNSKLADHITGRYKQLPLILCRYDKPYNFSDKCNQGAWQATGEIIVFFNDDVRPLNREWLKDLIELMSVPGVGAVSPKLVYENHHIQHAGLVTGVRGLVGTAFHCQPEASTEYFCFAQSVRDVSAVSGACFGIRRQVFIDIGGFDAVNTPIMHSDVDLSFKVREAGLRCVYTPHATLLHIGHQSLREYDKKQAKDIQDKADIFLLKRWGSYLSYDPYYTDNMRGLLYHDSPEMYGMFGTNRPELSGNRPDVLVVTHDLSASGAPMMAYLATKHLLMSGAFPVVATPEDGPMRAMFKALGVPVIIDSLLLTQHDSVRKLARNFDCVLANAIVTWPVVYQLLDHPTPVIWYLHESHQVSAMAKHNPQVKDALRRARHVYAGSERSASFCRPLNDSVNVLPYGVPDMYAEDTGNADAQAATAKPIVFSIFGTIELRKGQDTFLEAICLIDKLNSSKAEFNLVGRTLDPTWVNKCRKMAEGLKNVRFHEAVEHHQYQQLLRDTDVIVCASRDDTLPLVTLDALSMGKLLICTATTGTSAFLTNNIDGIVIPHADPEALANAMVTAIENPTSIGSIGTEARKTYLRNFTEQKFSERIMDVVRTVSRSAQ